MLLEYYIYLLKILNGKDASDKFYVCICSDIFTESGNRFLNDFYIQELFLRHIRAACDAGVLQTYNLYALKSELLAYTVKRGDMRLHNLPLPDLNSGFASNDTDATSNALMTDPYNAMSLIQLNQFYKNLIVPYTAFSQIYSAYNNGLWCIQKDMFGANELVFKQDFPINFKVAATDSFPIVYRNCCYFKLHTTDARKAKLMAYCIYKEFNDFLTLKYNFILQPSILMVSGKPIAFDISGTKIRYEK